MPMLLTFAAVSAEAAAAAAAASAAMTAAAPIAATTAATTAAATLPAAAAAVSPELAAAAIPGLQGGAAGALSGAGAAGAAPAAGIAPTAGGIAPVAPEAAYATNQASALAANTPPAGGIATPPPPTSVDPNAAFAANQSSAQGINSPFVEPTPIPNQVSQSFPVDKALEQGGAPWQYESAVTDPSRVFNPEAAQSGNAFSRGIDSALKFTKDYPLATNLGLSGISQLLTPKYEDKKKKYKGYTGNFQATQPSTAPYNPIYQPTPYAVGGPVEQLSADNSISANQMYPQAQLQTDMYSNPMVQRPMPNNVISGGIDAGVDAYTGEPRFATGGEVDKDIQRAKENRRLLGIRSQEEQDAQMEAAKSYNAKGMTAGKKFSRTQETYSPFTAATKEYAALAKKYGIPVAPTAKTSVDVSGSTEDVDFAANGGIMHGLGGYSDGGRLLKGPGDGVSDSIPAVIGDRQPARLADGEFVIPARIVSELGNGSTEAGARQLYAMMKRIQSGRKKSIGKDKVAVNSKATKHLPR